MLFIGGGRRERIGVRKGLDTPDAKQLSLFNFRRVCTIIGKSGSDEQVLEIQQLAPSALYVFAPRCGPM